MNSYTVGNLVGRLVLSYLVVWGLMLIFSRVNWRLALRRSYRWYGVTMTLLLFLGGLAAVSR
jgi:Ca2+/Na+ antiporter